VIVCAPVPSSSNVRPTPNPTRVAYWSNVPRDVPSIETAALPWDGPLAVYQVTEDPAKSNEAVPPARCSTAYDPPRARAFDAFRHV
jgi:hypothetical protein